MELRLYSKPESEIVTVEVEGMFTLSESDMTETIDGSKDADIDW